MAVANYVDAHGHYPPAYLADENGKPMHSWRVLILPYIEMDHLLSEYDFCEPWNGPNNSKLASRMPKIFALHGEERPGNTTTNYLAVVGHETVWTGKTSVTHDAVTDPSSTTILLVENLGAGVHWMEPRDLNFAEMDFAITSPKGISSKYVDPAVAMLDGTLYRLQKDLRPETLRALLTAKGGENVRQDDKGGWQWLPDGRDRELRP